MREGFGWLVTARAVRRGGGIPPGNHGRRRKLIKGEFTKLDMSRVHAIPSTTEWRPIDEIEDVRFPTKLVPHVGFEGRSRLLVTDGRSVLAGDGVASKVELGPIGGKTGDVSPRSRIGLTKYASEVIGLDVELGGEIEIGNRGAGVLMP
jgi:hypothetical protein